MIEALKKYSILGVIVLNLAIALGFFVENRHKCHTVFVSDVLSITPIGVKFDDPSTYQKDLYLNDLDNVRYYTPFFVQPMRFFASIMGNYIQGINLFGLLASLCFGLLWFFVLFRVTNSLWAALIVSVLMRGIVWLPGLEMWGISGLWSIMPRTIYYALMPLPFLFFNPNQKEKFPLVALLTGLVFNFHPISGLGGVIIFCGLYLYAEWQGRFQLRPLVGRLLTTAGALLLGMLPFIYNYFSKTDTSLEGYDAAAFKEAFYYRIPESFEDPMLFLEQWVAVKTLFFAVPLLLLLILSFYHKRLRVKAYLLWGICLALLVLPLLSLYVESWINAGFGTNLRMAFQLVRIQKLAVLPGFFALAFLLTELKNYKYVLPCIFALFSVIILTCKSSFYDKIPFAGNDIARFILPESFNLTPSNRTPDCTSTDRMMTFIKANTPEDAVFVGPPIIRIGARRSVILDVKGSSSLIEGNPKRLIEWHQRRKKLDALTNMSERTLFFKESGADYLLTRHELQAHVELVHTEGKLNLYKLR